MDTLDTRASIPVHYLAMFKASYKIATVWGIPIKVHISLVLLLLYLAFQWGPIHGLLIAIGLLVSIALHELGHSLVAMRKGCRVREITLMFLGGAAQMERIPTKPLDEFLMAIAGPAVSLGLGLMGLFVGPHLPLPLILEPPYSFNIIMFLGAVNLSLTVFNLMPAFPMDGGRVVRAMLTPKLGRLRATLFAARLGKVIAVLMALFGLKLQHPWLIFIAIFVFFSAGREYRMVQMQEAAKHPGHKSWPPFFAQEPEEPVDKVIIGPPPYGGKKKSEADVHQERDDNPFTNIFGSGNRRA